MLTATPKMVVHLCDGSTDLRKSFTGLSALVKTQLKADPLSGHLFVFTNRTHTRVKAYYWDGTGEVITMKKLHGGHLPVAGAGRDHRHGGVAGPFGRLRNPHEEGLVSPRDSCL